jgi:hypothetical protein
MALPLSKLLVCSVHDRLINEYAAFSGLGIGRGTKVLGEELTQSHFVHPTSHMT